MGFGKHFLTSLFGGDLQSFFSTIQNYPKSYFFVSIVSKIANEEAIIASKVCVFTLGSFICNSLINWGTSGRFKTF